MAVHIIPNQAVVQNADGTAYLFAWADTEAELSGVTEIDGFTVGGGSMSVALDTGNILGYTSTGTWSNLTDPESNAAAASLTTLSSPKSARIPESEVQKNAEADSAGSDEGTSGNTDK